jgi:hypothetical protein
MLNVILSPPHPTHPAQADPEDALRRGIVDVPLLLQTELAEMDTYENNAIINNMSASEYTAFISHWFLDHGFHSSSTDSSSTGGAGSGGGGNGRGAEDPGAVVAELYAAELAVSTELAHQVFLAEYSFLCGNLALATIAAASPLYTSNVFASVGVHAPTHPLHVIPGHPPSRYPGHNWDLVAAIRSWDFYGIHFGSPVYQHGPEDISWGDLMRKEWIVLHQGGEGVGFPPVNGTRKKSGAMGRGAPITTVEGGGAAANGGGAHSAGGSYFVGLQNGTGVQVAENYSQTRCAALSTRIGLDKRFWLVN